jgi:sterol desaturase/sphingolipid hydroxylase (fatty acid hydroxylase superfamily)
MTITEAILLNERSGMPETEGASSTGPQARSARLGLNWSATGITAVGLVVVIMGVRQPSLVASVVDGWVRMTGPAILVFVCAITLCERIRPAEPRPLLSRGHIHDLLYLAVYVAVVVPFVVILNQGFFRMVAGVAPWVVLPRSAHLPSAVTFCIAFIVMDGANWLGHWMNHRFGAFWRFHAVHHSQEELSVLTTFRAHPLVHVSFLLSVLPVMAISSGVVLPLSVISAYVCTNALTHANLKWSYGPLGKAFVSPAYHRIHHAYGADMGLNLGAVLTVWDLLSGRAAFPPPESATPPTGLVVPHVPLEQRTSTWRPGRVLIAQLAEPFAVEQAADVGGKYQPAMTKEAYGGDVNRSGAGRQIKQIKGVTDG